MYNKNEITIVKINGKVNSKDEHGKLKYKNEKL